MGPEPPKRLERVTPKKVRDKVNELIKYAVATHIKEMNFEAETNEVIELPDGITIKIKK